jgi:two-component system cell cycle sensor histidine kinase/response regulator CckA
MNLAVNARDAMPSGGKLVIETANAELDEAYVRSHGGMAAGRYVMFSVSDTGVGMPPELRERIFDPFFTTKEKGKGTGLGLSMVYGIVKQTGGNIFVYSEPGRGSVFKVYLPSVEEETSLVAPRHEPLSMPQGNETILLVEDEHSVRSLAARVLKAQSYHVLEAADGQEALLLVQKHREERHHLLVTDVVMPQMGGRELADRLRTLRPGIKVLFTSGYTDHAIVHHGILERGIEFLQKPFSPSALGLKVRKVLDNA